ncbi:glutathione S-transferase family protein [Rhodobacteraceae bacterium DSL-40]|uniref:glutathione S-transferase family protein n=1 Tax=Amaricoccus sp. B4 TaxID=3368557 RepID=UPI000DAEF80A
MTDTPIELWHAADTRSFRVLWALEEIGVGYTLHPLPFPPRAKAPDYLAVNPLGTVPAFRQGAVLMLESVAIVQYLAQRYPEAGLALGISEPEFGAWLDWLHFGEAALTFPLAIVLRYTRFEPGRADQAAEDYGRWFGARLRRVEAGLEGRDWLCADRFTGADISVGFALLLADFLGLAPRFGPNVTAYWQRLQARPGFQAAKRAQGSSLAELLAP